MEGRPHLLNVLLIVVPFLFWHLVLPNTGPLLSWYIVRLFCLRPGIFTGLTMASAFELMLHIHTLRHTNRT